MDKTISVIIPVYNVAAYLPECLDSVLSQSYRALEVIVVDDGSTDGSGQICDEYAAKDSRVHVIHQQNGGAASAKNAGLRAASGEYLTFADSDDVVESGAYAYMVYKMEENGADVIQCAFCDLYVNRRHKRQFFQEDRRFTANEYLLQYTVNWTCGLLWDKLYKRELFDGIFFEEGHKIDDEYFTYQGIMNAKTILYSPQIVYNYRKRKSGVMMSPESAQRIVADRLDYTQKRRKNVLARFADLKAAYDEHYANSLIILYRDMYASPQTRQEIRRSIKVFVKERPAPKIGMGIWWQLKQIQYNLMKVKFITSEEAFASTEDCFV